MTRNKEVLALLSFKTKVAIVGAGRTGMLAYREVTNTTDEAGLIENGSELQSKEEYNEYCRSIQETSKQEVTFGSSEAWIVGCRS